MYQRQVTKIKELSPLLYVLIFWGYRYHRKTSMYLVLFFYMFVQTVAKQDL